MFFKRPYLRPDVKITTKDGEVHLALEPRLVRLNPTDPAALGQIEAFCRLIQSDSAGFDLRKGSPYLSAEQVRHLLEKLDEHSLLLEGPDEVTGARHGRCVIARIESKYRDAQAQSGTAAFMKLLYEGALDDRCMIGNAFEYYHITARAYDSITPVLERLFGRNQGRALNFVLDEYRHDAIMIRALYALGYKKQDIEQSLPLPCTLNLVNFLERQARTDPLAFTACLFPLEPTAEVNELYKNALGKYSLPPDYVASHLEHDLVNEDGQHDAISRIFYSEIAYVSEEDEERVTAKLRMLHAILRSRSDNMLAYYSNPENPLLRLATATVLREETVEAPV